MKFGAKKNPTVLAGGSRFAPNFIQNLYTVLKKRLWESRSTPTLVVSLSNCMIHSREEAFDVVVVVLPAIQTGDDLLKSFFIVITS
jgi:hypothetical protein